MLINGVERSIAPGADLHGANLRRANFHDADLYGANLRGADLHGANLRRANFHDADLYGADLRGASLYGADLRGADLHGADLRGADLHGADLYGANLYSANLPSGFKVCRMDFGEWSILVMPDNTTIGCQSHSNEMWLKFTPEDVSTFAEGASEYWKQHGKAIKAVIRDVMSK